eukprot:scaffold1566_cov150-Skeletonema_menzelii.AAC.1
MSVNANSFRMRLRWTDDDLLSILGYSNGDFTVAIEIILRHEATGRPPEELIRFMRIRAGGWQYFDGSSSPDHRGHSHSETENIQRQSVRNDSDLFRGQAIQGSDGEGVVLNRIGSESLVSPSYVSSAPPSSSTLTLLEGEGKEADTSSRSTAFGLERQQIVRTRSENTHDVFSRELRSGAGAIPSPSSSTAAVVDNSTQTQQQRDLSRSERSQREHNYDQAEAKAPKSRHQHILEIWDMQSGIEASLKDTKNTAAKSDDDMDDEAVSYAIKVSKETFDEAYRKQELCNALEKRMIKISLAASLSDPIKKSEEELMGEALKMSLAEPVQKSEEQLLEEARENSLRDLEKLETIMKSEEELVEAAKQKSLHTMSADEELIEAVKRRSLESLSATQPVVAADDSPDYSSCVEVEYPPPSSSRGSDIDVDLRWIEKCLLWYYTGREKLWAWGRSNPQRSSRSRLRSDSHCSSSSSVEIEHLTSSRFGSSLMEDSDEAISSSSFVAFTDTLSSTSSDQTKEGDNNNRSGACTK